MINGVTILNEELCNEGSTVGHIISAIIFIICVLLDILIIITSIRERTYEGLYLLIPAILCSILMFLLTIITPKRLNDTYSKYEVTISDDVSLKEFTDKYSIIEQRGDIYVIKEKDNG